MRRYSEVVEEIEAVVPQKYTSNISVLWSYRYVGLEGTRYLARLFRYTDRAR